MAKDIKVSNGVDTIIINPDSLAKFKKLGYNELSSNEHVVVKKQPKKLDIKPNSKE
jgi:hypothetical protein